MSRSFNREEQEKLNVWVALMNLENLYGTQESLVKVFERALQQNKPKKVFFQLIGIYTRTDKFEVWKINSRLIHIPKCLNLTPLTFICLSWYHRFQRSSVGSNIRIVYWKCMSSSISRWDPRDPFQTFFNFEIPWSTLHTQDHTNRYFKANVGVFSPLGLGYICYVTGMGRNTARELNVIILIKILSGLVVPLFSGATAYLGHCF